MDNIIKEVLPTVSVIIPVFRVEKYLKRCIDSVLRQSYQDFEIILVDDGSDDNCPEICDVYANTNNKIHVIHQNNQGLSAARNAGLRIARGQFISFIDSDDWLHKNYLELLVQNIGEAAVCCCGYKRVSKFSEDLPESVDNIIIYSFEEALQHDNCNINVWNKLYRKSVISTIRFDPNLKYSEDRSFNAELFAKNLNKRCVYLPNKLYYYFANPNALTQTTSFSDLPAIEKMIALAEETNCETLLKYLIDWLCYKRRTGYHIGNPPDYSKLDMCLKKCSLLCKTMIHNTGNRFLLKMKIKSPLFYSLITRLVKS